MRLFVRYRKSSLKSLQGFARAIWEKRRVRIPHPILIGAIVMKNCRRFLLNAEYVLKNNILLVLLVFSLLTVISRFSIAYSGSIVAAPESIFQLNPIGRDLYIGLYEPALALVRKSSYLNLTSAVGPGLQLIAGPLIHNYLFFKGYCVYVRLGCHYLFYQRFLIISSIGWFIFMLLMMRNTTKESRLVMLMYFTLFLLGIPGSMIIERGNIDLLLSLFVGILLFSLVQVSKRQFTQSFSRVISVFIGIIGGFLVNAKLFLLPFVFVSLFAAPSVFLATAASVFTFYGLTYYLPSVLYGVNITLRDLWWTSIVSANEGIRLFYLSERLAVTHSLEATVSLFVPCGAGVCSNENIIFISFVSKILFIVLFVIPVGVLLLRLMKKNREQLMIHMKDKTFILFFFIFIDAFINLFLQISFLYRLSYSVPILLLVYRETAPNSRSRWYCYLSMIFLAVKGLWISYTIIPVGISIFDARAMNLFVVLHFYYLVKAGLAGIEEQFSRFPVAS